MAFYSPLLSSLGLTQIPENDSELPVDDFSVKVTRRKMKNLRLKVDRGSGEVLVSAPHWISQNHIKNFVRSQKAWIAKQRVNLKTRPQQILSLTDGSTVSILGVDHQITIFTNSKRNRVALADDAKLNLYFAEEANIDTAHTLLGKVYRDKLKQMIPELLDKWQPIVGESVNEFGVKKMKTKWGSCNINVRRIWLNLELAKYPAEILEYVLVHELTHLHERYHNARFRSLMSQFMPDWQERENRLNNCFIP